MKQHITIITILLLAVTTLALAQVDSAGVAWVKRWSSPGYLSDYVYGLTVDNDGNVYVTGSSDYLGSISDIITMKYGPTGDSIWASLYSRTNSQLARSVAVGNSGCVYITGYTMESGNGDYITIKYFPNGDTEWVRRYNGIGLTRYDFSRKLVLDNQENVYVSGYSAEQNYRNTHATLKYDSSGTLLWARRDSFGGMPQIGYPNDLALDNSGNPYIVTRTPTTSHGFDYVVVKYKAETGDTYWVRTYNGPADSTDDARGIAFDNSGNIYVTGMSYASATGYDIATIKYNSSGDTQWVRRWSNPDTAATDAGYWIAVDGLGNVYVYGTTYSKAPANQDLVVLKYNSNGVFQWAKKYDGPATGADQIIDKDGQNGMALDPYGFIYVTGYCRQLSPTTRNDFVTIKFSPDGDTIWTRKYNYADSLETARSMFVDNLGNVYVTGQSGATGTYNDIATIKYFQSDFTIRDVQVSKLEVPAMVDSGYVVAPACSVYNNGDSTENYQVRMKIGSFYNNTLPVTNHAPNTYQYLTFPNWTAIQRGNQVVSCSTELSVDMIHSNDRKLDTVLVRVLDVGVTKIEAPIGTVNYGTVLTPACSVYNYGTTSESYRIRTRIGSFYNDTVRIVNHAPGTYQYVTFPNWTATQLGTHAVSCSTELASDVNLTNDKEEGTVTVSAALTGWVKMASIPILPSGKRPKAGTSMAGLRGKIYCLKASNTQDFLIYTPDDDTGTWTNNIEDTIPFGIRADGDGKRPKKGAAMTAYNQTRSVYALRGNNTLGFWRYQADTLDTVLPGWKKLKNIPLGLKAPKDGSGLASFRSQGIGYIFAMKGSRTDEFYIYTIENDTWAKVSSPPSGPSGKIGYKKGSCLAYDGDEYVYVLKGNYGDFFKYNLENDTWIQLERYDSKFYINRDGKKKKPKDGASLVYCDDYIYLLKGGNTREVWRINVSADTGKWAQMDTLWDIPLGMGKRVKSGGNMILFGDNFYAIKGGNTDEFYRHGLPTSEATNSPNLLTNEGTMTNKFENGLLKLTISPNPAINVTTVSYTLPKAGPVSFRLFDVTGSMKKSYANTIPTKQGIVMINTKELPAGVYILRFNSSDIRITRKLVVEK